MGLPTVEPQQVLDRLGGGAEYSRWLDDLATVQPTGEPFAPPPLPTDPELAALGLTALDRSELPTTRPLPAADPELWWLWSRCRSVLLARIGRLLPVPDWPNLPPDLGAKGRYFFAHVHLSVLDEIREWHRGRGITAEVSLLTLTDLGAKLDSYRRTWGTGGLDRQNWLCQHFDGSIFRLGRLQFDRGQIPPPIDGRSTQIGWPMAGEPALGMHIPEDGPLTTAACDDSLRRARAFFREVFPEDGYRVVTCQSWLLDDQLMEYLPTTANILAFRSLFTLWDGWVDGDVDIMEFVFRRVPGEWDGLPQDTTLQRAIVDHFRQGRHWRVRRGWRWL